VCVGVKLDSFGSIVAANFASLPALAACSD
jgi:hypothetical protein